MWLEYSYYENNRNIGKYMVPDLDKGDIENIRVIAGFETRGGATSDIETRNMGGFVFESRSGAPGYYATSEISPKSGFLSLHMMNILCLI